MTAKKRHIKNPTKKSPVPKKPEDIECFMRAASLAEDQRLNDHVIDVFVNFGKRTKRQANALLKKYRQLVPLPSLDLSELDYLQTQQNRREKLLTILKFPDDVNVELEEMEHVFSEVKLLLLQLCEDPEFELEESASKIVINVTTLIKIMRAAFDAKEIRTLLRDMDLAKQRIEFLKQI